MSRENRLKIIRSIQEKRNSFLLTYITGDRQGSTAQISGDAIRPMYDHIRHLTLESTGRIDLFLYSMGGAVDVPWRLVSMLREYCEELNVLVPFHAHSAATLICLGADNIIMGRKGELGPIDPQFNPKQNETGAQNPIGVEDIMAFITFIKERAGIGDQLALAKMVKILIEKLDPWTVGSVYRIHSHIRLIARKLITSRKHNLEERQINAIIDALAEKMFFHGHAIGITEAEELELPVTRAPTDLENLMWQLFESYEELMKLRIPVQPEKYLSQPKEEASEDMILACIESEKRIHAFRGELQFRQIRSLPPQLAMNININPSLPQGMDPNQISPELQAYLEDYLKIIRETIVTLAQSELEKQAPIQRIESRHFDAYWKDITDSNL